MPYFLFLIGIVLVTMGFYRFFLKATTAQIKTFFLSVAASGVGLAAIWLTLTGRLPAAVAVLTALWPIAVSYMRNKPAKTSETAAPQTSVMTQKEAYDILGLEEGASADDIKAAHLQLMKKLHPDVAGTDWMAQKLNAARDFLLKP